MPMQHSNTRRLGALLSVAALALLAACSGSDAGDDVVADGGSSSGGRTSLTTGGAASPASGGMAPSSSGGAQAAQGGSGALAGNATGGAASSGGSTSGGSGGNAGLSGGGFSGRFTGGSANGGSAGGGGTSAGSGGAQQAGAAGDSNGGKSAGGAAGAAGSASAGAANGGGGGAGTQCPYTGHITYTLMRAANPSAEQTTAYGLITTAMDKAIGYYNCYTDITKSLTIQYVPSVQTADGNANGTIRFGSNKTYMDYRSAMHEIGHTVGVGQASNWGSFVTADKLFTGANANAELQAINATLTKPEDTKVHADNQHFWPYGLNQQSEVHSEQDLLFHCRMVMAIRKDLGLK